MTYTSSINARPTSGTAIVGNGTGFSNIIYTNVNTGSTLAERDANGNCSFNNAIETTTSTVSAGQTVVMTAGSSQNQFITGSSTIQFNLPDATTLIEGWTFVFNNISTGIVTINQQNGSTLVTTVLAGGFTEVLCTDNTTVQGVWNFHNALGTGSLSGTLGTTLLGFVSANTVIPGYTTTATAAATTTLTVASTQQQYFTGTTTQTVVLPVTSTLVLGQSFTIVNNSTGIVTVQSSGANTIQAMAAGTSLTVTCILTSGTTASSWSVYSISTLNILGSTSGSAPSAGYIGEQIRSYQPTPQTLTSGTPLNITSISLTAGVWDVSCLVEFSLGGLVALTQISINNVSSVINSNDGDNTSTYNNGSIQYIVPMSIPSFRITLSTTTIYYLVSLVNVFSGITTPSAYGRISATRVG